MPISPLVHAKEWIHREVGVALQGCFLRQKCKKPSDSPKASEYSGILLINNRKCQVASAAYQKSTQRLTGSEKVLEIETIGHKWAKLQKDESNQTCTEVTLVKEEAVDKRILTKTSRRKDALISYMAKKLSTLNGWLGNPKLIAAISSSLPEGRLTWRHGGRHAFPRSLPPFWGKFAESKMFWWTGVTSEIWLHCVSTASSSNTCKRGPEPGWDIEWASLYQVRMLWYCVLI